MKTRKALRPLGKQYLLAESLLHLDRNSTTAVLRVCCPVVYASGLRGGGGGGDFKTSWWVKIVWWVILKTRKALRPFGKHYLLADALVHLDRNSTTVILCIIIIINNSYKALFFNQS